MPSPRCREDGHAAPLPELALAIPRGATTFRALLHRRVRAAAKPFPVSRRSILPWALFPFKILLAVLTRVRGPRAAKVPEVSRGIPEGSLLRASMGTAQAPLRPVRDWTGGRHRNGVFRLEPVDWPSATRGKTGLRETPSEERTGCPSNLNPARVFTFAKASLANQGTQALRHAFLG
jgi:hypothetical protein